MSVALGTKWSNGVDTEEKAITVLVDTKMPHEMLREAEGQFHDLDRRIFWVGDLKSTNVAPGVGTIVQKTGRTTNWTTGRITNINATVDVNYGGGRVARFAQQLLTTDMSADGDSGSLVADLNENAAGLLFAGSPVVTVINTAWSRLSRVDPPG
ncbi:hypothetical protein [Amycolatopsis sp. NPDC051071]|uniref:hypothetical protein n=1 Tax=Amycolatopsis sp. NPDC051071 TaxID=3154637 RepID=UPI003438A3A5